MSDHSAFWDDLAADMEDPEFRAAYLAALDEIIGGRP